MASTPIDLTSKASGTRSTSAAPSGSSLPNAFGRMMAGKGPAQEVLIRDKCKRPEPEYNTNYNPYEQPRKDLHGGYSPYVFGEPLWDDRAIVVARLPKNFTIAGPSKRPRTQWVWRLGYAFTDNKKQNDPKPPTFWACKHCELRATSPNNKLILDRPP